MTIIFFRQQSFRIVWERESNYFKFIISAVFSCWYFVDEFAESRFHHFSPNLFELLLMALSL